MRLISAEIRGHGRLADAKVNLDTKVVAVVGPNEVGKTTFLRALAFLTSGTELKLSERSRATKPSDDAVVTRVRFAVEEDDLLALKGRDLESPPHTLQLGRRAGGGDVLVSVEPRPRKAVKPLHNAIKVLEQAAELKRLQRLISQETVFADPEVEGARDFRFELQRLAQTLRGLTAAPDEHSEEEAAELARELTGALIPGEKANRLREALNTARMWLEADDPSKAVGAILRKRSPDFLLFDEPNRELQSLYSIDSLAGSVPAGLDNLARMAGIDLQELAALHRAPDTASAQTLLLGANNQLRDLFSKAWKQSRLTVSLRTDGDLLRVDIIEDSAVVTPLDERSAGLRMFVAIIAFLFTRNSRNPVLLIDEAENHLHIDAQADLVNMFMWQDKAARIIYTTHSPACLPPDLGLGIRSIVPSKDNEHESKIRNEFWSDGAGYSPLMIAMGAAAAAFTTARYVLLGEGATEMILLPSLLREATGLDSLPYQVAAGLSQVPTDFYPSLDLVGARVAYLIDSDREGQLLRKKLMEHGVREAQIVVSPAPGLENLLIRDNYVSTVTALLGECNRGKAVSKLPSLTKMTERAWAGQLDSWAQRNSLTMPSKVAVASRIIQERKAVPSAECKELLVELHGEILKALEV